jgi:hypothetical protein
MLWHLKSWVNMEEGEVGLKDVLGVMALPGIVLLSPTPSYWPCYVILCDCDVTICVWTEHTDGSCDGFETENRHLGCRQLLPSRSFDLLLLCLLCWQQFAQVRLTVSESWSTYVVSSGVQDFASGRCSRVSVSLVLVCNVVSLLPGRLCRVAVVLIQRVCFNWWCDE